MNKSARCLFALVISCCVVAPVRAEDEISAGQTFALKVCSVCHVVAEDQRFAPILKPPAPSFLDLARRSDVSEASLRQFLSAPHGSKGKGSKMPNAMLAQYQIDEVVAYLLSLKRGSGAK
jgi:cytochrome c2